MSRQLQKDFLRAEHSAASGVWEQMANLSNKVTLEFINTILLIAPTAVTSTIMKLGSYINAISKFLQKTAKLFGAIQINVTDVFLKKEILKSKFFIFNKILTTQPLKFPLYLDIFVTKINFPAHH